MPLPRSFKIMEDLEKQGSYPGISYGLKDDDFEAGVFTVMLISPTGNASDLEVTCGSKYPCTMPIVKIIDSPSDDVWKLFDDDTMIMYADCDVLNNWDPETSSLQTILQYVLARSH
jgi:hypothetical protein